MVASNMVVHRYRRFVYKLVLIIAVSSTSSKASKIIGLYQKAQNFAKEHLNLSRKFIQHTSSLTPYDRITACPAFAVTTPWGSPYMIFDSLKPTEAAREEQNQNYFTGKDDSDLDSGESVEQITEYDSMADEDVAAQQASMNREMAKQSFGTRTTALFFTDPEDAQHMVDEMKQMGNGMDRADIRVMATSMGRALRQTSRLGRGLPTGQPVDEMTGRLDNSAIRYKIVPSKRELFYAATRCLGKERVGFFGDTPDDDGRSILLPTTPDSDNDQFLPRKRPSAAKKKKSLIAYKWRNMRGETGIPVFYMEGLKRKGKKGTVEEIPLFFSYEDLCIAWNQMRSNAGDKALTRPTFPEVFNFVDVVVAMERSQWQKRMKLDRVLKNVHSNPWVQKIVPTRLVTAKNNVPMVGDDDLDKIVFIPSSRAIQFTDNTSKSGNGKARLRPMR